MLMMDHILRKHLKMVKDKKENSQKINYTQGYLASIAVVPFYNNPSAPFEMIKLIA